MLYKVRARSVVAGSANDYEYRLFLVVANNRTEAWKKVRDNTRFGYPMGNAFSAYPVKFDKNGLCHLQTY